MNKNAKSVDKDAGLELRLEELRSEIKRRGMKFLPRRPLAQCPGDPCISAPRINALLGGACELIVVGWCLVVKIEQFLSCPPSSQFLDRGLRCDGRRLRQLQYINEFL